MTRRRRRSDRSGRAPLFSPGRPPVAGREVHRQFWAAIATGMASMDAAVHAGMSQPVGARLFREAGGMPPAMFWPSAKPLSGRYLSFAEREEIALLRVQGCSMREVARRLGRAASTLSRELRRNAATRSGGLEYRATTAQWHAERSARRPKQAKLALNAALRTYVQERLAGVVVAPSGAAVPGPAVRWKGRRQGPRKHRRWANSWSPQQIARRLPVDFPDDETMRISHEAIYQALFVQSRGALRRELTACLRTGRVLRVPRARTRGRGKTFIFPEIMISERPAEAVDRAVPGHWEGDLILGLGSSAIGTLVERMTRFTLLLHLPRMTDHGHEARIKNGPALAGHGAEAVCDAITRTIITLPEQLRRSLTWDQGAEMAQHARLKIEAGIEVYFSDPHSPWQRGTNENTNGLLRQYFPKGTDLSTHSADEIAAVAAALNGRPRKTLAWQTPAEALERLLVTAMSSDVRN
jgi:IS30 family transposase